MPWTGLIRPRTDKRLNNNPGDDMIPPLFHSSLARTMALSLLLASTVHAATAPNQISAIPEEPTTRYLSVLAGGSDDLAGQPALTFSFDDSTVALSVDSLGRIYFENRGVIRRMEADGRISSFRAGSQVVDFTIAGGFIYFMEQGSPDVMRANLGSGTVSKYVTVDGLDPDNSWQTQLAVSASGDVFTYSFTFSGNFSSGLLFQSSPVNGETTRVGGRDWDCPDFDCQEPAGDSFPALEAYLDVRDMVVDPGDGSILLADTNWWATSPDEDEEEEPPYNRVLRFHPDTGQLELIAEGFVPGAAPTFNYRTINSLDLLPDGDILVTDGERYVYRLNPDTGDVHTIAGSGAFGIDGDGGPALEAAMEPDQLAADSQGNFYFSTVWEPSNATGTGQRIRFVDGTQDVVSTVIGLPGALACAESTERMLLNANSLLALPNGTIALQANNAVLLIDRDLDAIYSIAGYYGTRGESEDGQPAYGNPVSPYRPLSYSPGLLAAGPGGDIYLAETNRIRRIDLQTGLLSTLTNGSFRSLQIAQDGWLYAVRQEMGLSGDAIFEDDPEFVRIDPESGALTVLVGGGEEAPAVGQSLQGKSLRYMLVNAAFGSGGSIYLLLNGFDLSGLFRVDPQGWTLESIGPADTFRGVSADSSLALSESEGKLFVTGLIDYESGEQLPVAALDLDTGELSRVAGTGLAGSEYPVDPLSASFEPRDIAVSAAGELFVVDAARDRESQAVLLLSVEKPESTLIPEDVAAGASAGNSVASLAEWLAIGAPDNPLAGGRKGEVLLYRDNDCRPILQQRITAPEGTSAEAFGSAVAFVDGALVIGAAASGSASQLQSSTETDVPFRLGLFGLKQGRSWTLDQDLTSLLPPSGSGDTLASDGRRFAVGSPGANGGQGTVTVFDLDAIEVPTTVQPAGDSTGFGRSLAMASGRLAVGAADNAGGRVELYQRSGTQYQSQGSIASTDASPDFATALALNDQALYVGSPQAAGGRVYDYTLGDLALADTLADPADPTNPSFGAALAVEDGVLVVGAPDTQVASVQATAPALTAAADGATPQSGVLSGAVTTFTIKDPAGVRQPGQTLFRLLAQNAAAYGQAVDISNGRIVVGAPETDEGRGSFESVGRIVDAAQLSGLWYDPSQDGEGFNVLVAEAGLVVFFYGYDTQGERLWLVSETLSGNFGFGEDIHVPLYKAVAGEFAAPSPSAEALVRYGLLSMSFGSLRSATFTVTGFDGNKISRNTFLADTGANQARYSGLWYDPAQEGEGFNVISGQPGSVIYYYGSTDDGERLWLVSELLSNDIQAGSTLQGTMYDATGGDFYHPAPSSAALRNWGSIEARFDDCDQGRFILTGSDGNKTSQVVKLAGVQGAACP